MKHLFNSLARRLTVLVFLFPLVLHLQAQDEDLVDPFGALDAPVEEAEEATEEAAEEETIPEGIGSIGGQIFDAESKVGETVAGVSATLDDTEYIATSDDAGNYVIENVPSGVYTLTFIKSGYRTSKVKGLKVYPDKRTPADFALPILPVEFADDIFDLEAFEVTAEELSQQAFLFEELRVNAINAVDLFSAEDFEKFAPSDVAEAITRIPGVTVAEGKFAIIRGLSDRYSNTTLNGLPIPSPDPDRQSVQLDIFPSKFVSNIAVSKSFSAEQPGNSAGGSINLSSKAFPEDRILSFSVGTGFDETVVGNDFRTFETNGNNHRFANGAVDLRGLPPAGTSIITLSPDDVFISQIRDPSPDYSFSVEYGESFQLAEKHKLSLYTTTNISRKRSANEGTFADFDTTVNSTFVPPFFFTSTLVFAQTEQYPEYTTFTDEAKLGSLGAIGYQFNEQHEVSFLTLFNRVAIQEVRFGENGTILDSINNSNPSFIENITREELYYNQRELLTFQVNGSSTFELGDVFKPELSWGYTNSTASQDEPDFRLNVYFEDNGVFSNVPTPSENPNFPSLFRSFREIEEKNDAWGLHLKQEPVAVTDTASLALGLDLGFSSSQSDRTEQNFIAATGPLNGTIGSSPEDLFIASAFSFVGDADASRAIDSFYLSKKISLFKRLDIKLGARFEDFSLQTSGNTDLSDQRSLIGSFRNLTTVTDPESIAIASALNLPDSIPASQTVLTGDLQEESWYPSIQGSLEIIEGLKLKASYSRNSVRPSFKEFAPVLVVDTDTRDIDGGNPFLTLSDVESFDGRLEYFRDNGDLVAVSVFKKNIENPIEFIIIDTVNTPVTFAFNNPGGADLQGVEFEFNKVLDFIPYLENFSVGGNYAYIDAEVQVSESERATREASDTIGIIAPETRRLVEQPEFILNLNVSYSNEDWGLKSTLAYNRVSDVLNSVGGRDMFDRVDKENARFDFTLSKSFENGFKLSFAIKNLFENDKESVLVDPLTGEQRGVEQLVRGSRSYSFSVSREF